MTRRSIDNRDDSEDDSLYDSSDSVCSDTEDDNESSDSSDTESDDSSTEHDSDGGDRNDDVEKEVHICQITGKDSNDVYIFNTTSALKTRTQLIRSQYTDFLNGKESRKCLKSEMMQFIKDHGGINGVKFKRLETYNINNKSEIEEHMNKHTVQASFAEKKNVCSIAKIPTKSERFKKYYAEHKQKHIDKVKERYKENRDKILAQKKVYYSNRKKISRGLVHCPQCDCNVHDMVAHTKTQKHIKNTTLDPFHTDSDESDE